MLRAIIFDFDGVIVDTEPIHFRLFQEVLAEEGVSLTDALYAERYLALDDRGCFRQALGDAGQDAGEERVRLLIERKSGRFDDALGENITALPGVSEFIRSAALRYPLAIASGALRREIEMILERLGLRKCFESITSAEDVSRCKPDPEPFLTALSRLNECGISPSLRPEECLVIEDSIHGVEAARAAGMKCFAVTTSYPKERLHRADRVVDSLAEVTMDDLQDLQSERGRTSA